jgi:hypothetical protein
VDFFPPEQLVPLEAELARLGYPQSAIEGIMGGNFLRVAEQVWRPPAATFTGPTSSWRRGD